MTEDHEEKRKYKRVPTDVLATCRSGGRFFYAIIANISMMGLFIKEENPPEAGASIDLEFELAHHGAFKIRGSIAWSQKKTYGPNFGMGVSLDHIDDDALERLRRFVEEHP